LVPAADLSRAATATIVRSESILSTHRLFAVNPSPLRILAQSTEPLRHGRSLTSIKPREPTMQNAGKALRQGVVIAVLLTSVLAGASGAATFRLGSSPSIPAAEGKVKLRHTSNGNTEIQLEVKHLAPPARIDATTSVFVVWVRGLEAGAQPQSLGALRTNKKLSGKLKSVTSLREFDLFLTAEGTQTVTAPTTVELMQLHYTGKR
jgi:hypothetical protein